MNKLTMAIQCVLVGVLLLLLFAIFELIAFAAGYAVTRVFDGAPGYALGAVAFLSFNYIVAMTIFRDQLTVPNILLLASYMVLIGVIFAVTGADKREARYQEFVDESQQDLVAYDEWARERDQVYLLKTDEGYLVKLDNGEFKLLEEAK